MIKYLTPALLAFLIGIGLGTLFSRCVWRYEIERAVATERYYDNGSVYYFVSKETPKPLLDKEVAMIVYRGL